MESQLGSKQITLKKKRSIKSIFSSKLLLGLVVVLQLIMIFLILNPIAIIQDIQNRQLINEVASKTSLNTAETPVIATITNADTLRAENAIQAEVYKDAQSGDYVLAYTDKMIIYRRGEGRVIYEGDNPNQLLNKTQQKLIDDIVASAKEQGIIDSASKEVPQISIISDVKSLAASDPTFYRSARNNDIIVLFAESQVIALYNQETGEIFNHGQYQTTIVPAE